MIARILARTALCAALAAATLPLASCRGAGGSVRSGATAVERAALQRALASYLGGRYAEADRALTKFLTAHCGSALAGEARCWRGLARLKEKRYGAAVDDLQEALDEVLTPALAANARKGIADAHFARGAYRQARAAYYDVVEHSSAYVETDRMLYLAAVCDLKQGRWGEARRSLRTVVRRFPGRSWAAQARGLLEEDFHYFTVQCGAYTRRGDAVALTRRLAARGHVTRVERGRADGRTLYRVRAGRYATAREAVAAARRLRACGVDTAVLP